MAEYWFLYQKTMAKTGDLKDKPGPRDISRPAYRSKCSNEVASPGYYAITLDDYKIQPGLTAMTRTGFHRYLFPKTEV
jgi:putative alpha-1,2-mannosidase